MLIPFFTLPIGSWSWYISTGLHCYQFIFQAGMMRSKYLTIDKYAAILDLSAFANKFFSVASLLYFWVSSAE